MESKESQKSQNVESQENLDNQTSNNVFKDSIIDLPKLSMQTEIKNSEIILAILEICTFNKKYNYDCSNNTKAFWDRVVGEGILQKIFKNFKSETLRKYWKIIRQAGNTVKFVEVKKNEKFINNPVFKLLPLINSIAYYIQTDEKNFEDFFTVFNGKKLIYQKEEKDKEKDKNINIEKQSNNNDELKQSLFKKNNEMEIDNENSDDIEKMKDLDETVNKLMTISKLSREEVCIALYGTSYNIKNAFLYLKDNDKYDKYFFVKTDDYIIKNLRNKGYYKDLIEIKGIELVKEREKFLGIN